MTVVALKSGIKDFAQSVNRFAVRNENFAQELVYTHGIRGNVNTKNLKPITKDMFDASGKLTKKVLKK